MAVIIPVVTNNGAAAAAARARKVAYCNDYMPSFNHAGSTVAQRRAYAECVSVIHPGETSLAAKIAMSGTLGGLALVFLFMVAGIVCMAFDCDDGWPMRGAAVSFAIVPASLIVAAITWMVT